MPRMRLRPKSKMLVVGTHATSAPALVLAGSSTPQDLYTVTECQRFIIRSINVWTPASGQVIRSHRLPDTRLGMTRFTPSWNGCTAA
jgi:hypothetical protein